MGAGRTVPGLGEAACIISRARANAAPISPGNRMPFNSAEAAEATGFRPGADGLNR